MQRESKHYKILDAKAATGIGKDILVRDYRNLILMVATSGSANFTAKVVGSISESDVNFAAAQSVANPWGYVQVIDIDTGSAINGVTGIAATGTDIFKLYHVNVDGLEYLNLNVTAYAAGAITVELLALDNE